MSTIISGRFAQQEQVEQARSTIQQTGFAANRISSFYVNPAGQHDQFPIGGDRDESPGAEDSTHGTAKGLGAGGVIGAAAGSVGGPAGSVLGALVGAHVGSLVGTLAETDESKEFPPVRKAGMLVAIAVDSAEEEDRAIGTLRDLGATDLERAAGHIDNGDWADFDPLSPPHFIQA